MSSKVGRRHYGTVPLTVVNKAAWEAQDASKSWSDEGEVRSVIEQTIQQLEAIVAKNATLGASEYLAAGEASVTISNQNEILVGIKISNDEASFIAYVPLRALLISALQQARQTVGVDPQGQALVSSLIHFGTQLANLGRPAPSPSTQGPTP